MKKLLLFTLQIGLSCIAVNLTGDNYFTGPQVNSVADLVPYTGYAAVERIVGEWRQKAYLLNYEQMAVNYGNNVDFQLRQKQILLTQQTEKFLYEQYIPEIKYTGGSRPELEKTVAQIISGCDTTREKALALMRFCRDLKKQGKINYKDKNWQFGGTEEELIEKGEDLCETLGRLYVVLCEIAGIPARIIMHDIGGHITAEAYIDGHWGYVDPRFGIYFLRGDGSLASLRELIKEPEITRQQPESVKKDVAGAYTWEQRAERSRGKFFHPSEINGFQYYSADDMGLYNYDKVSLATVIDRGLFEVGEVNDAVGNHVFGNNPKIENYFWNADKLMKKLPMTWRNDGFSTWFEEKPPHEPESFGRKHFSSFVGSPVTTMVWGTGCGSVFTHRTKVGQIFGYAVKDNEWSRFNRGDKYVHDGITDLIARGIDPQQMIVEQAKKYGLEIFTRLEMNHEYPKSVEWMYLGFNGELCKQHPEYWVSETNQNLDYKHTEVRNFKLAILRELAEAGVDGVEVDLSVYPPFFAKPDAGIMTQFIRDVRKMLDEVGNKQNKRIALQITVPNDASVSMALDWQGWLKEGLVDRLIPGTAIRGRKYAFDLRIDDMARIGQEHNTRVYGYIDQALRMFTMDPEPDGKRRHARSKKAEEFRAQAMYYHRAGVYGIHFGMAVNRTYWERKEMFDSLSEPACIEFADKNYIHGPFPDPSPFRPERSVREDMYTMTQSVRLRIADDMVKAQEKGVLPKASLILNFRNLKPGENVSVFINGYPAGVFSGDDKAEQQRAVDFSKPVDSYETNLKNELLTKNNWWEAGVHALDFPADKLWLGENIIRFVYSATSPRTRKEIQVVWPEVRLKYPTISK